MRVLGKRRLRTDKVLTVHANGGLKKVCGCARKVWAKCPHPWHFSFKWRGQHHRFSLDRHFGRHVKSRTEAERLGDQLRTDIRAGTFKYVALAEGLVSDAGEIANSPDMTLREAGADWHKKRGYQLVAAKDNVHRFKRFCDFVVPGSESEGPLGERPLKDITANDIEAYRHARRSKGLSAVTTNHDLKLLRKMFSWFERNDYIEQTPFRFRGQVAIKLDRETPRNQRFADDKVEARLLAASEPLLHDIIVAMLDTCCRPGEILKLQWMDIDFLRKELTIRPANCKTREGRVIPITGRLLAILEARRLGPDGQRYPQDGFVFGEETGGKVKSVRRMWERACAKADVTGLHLADLRHEAGSRYEEAGMPTNYGSRLLGHRNLATTTRYLNPTSQHLHREVERIDEARRKAADGANSLQSGSQPAQTPGELADSRPAEKSLVS